jgi:hypothetical protein
MIELQNVSQAGLRHFVSVEWARTQERFLAEAAVPFGADTSEKTMGH